MALLEFAPGSAGAGGVARQVDPLGIPVDAARETWRRGERIAGRQLSRVEVERVVADFPRGRRDPRVTADRLIVGLELDVGPHQIVVNAYLARHMDRAAPGHADEIEQV